MYHDNLYWQECETIRTFDFLPRDIQNEIIKYCNKSYNMDRILTEEDIDDVQWLLDNYDCVMVRYKHNKDFTSYNEFECKITLYQSAVIHDIYRVMEIEYDYNGTVDIWYYCMRAQTLTGLYLRIGEKKK